MAIHAAWHERNVLPRGASEDERIRWHLEHAKECGCRPIPRGLRPRIEAEARAANVREGGGAERLTRCGWATKDPLYIRYHDEEWGVPSHDDRHLFEMILLEGAQAGLSWITILRKRENYRRAFDGFDAAKIARYDARKVKRLLADEGIVRNRLKIQSAIGNARSFLAVKKEFGSFDRFLWEFVGGAPIVNRPRTLRDVPARTPESDAMSKALAKRGFRFVGSTICYAFMQACGLVDDHVSTCFRARRRAASSR